MIERRKGRGRVSRDRARCNARAALHKQRRASQSAPAKVTRVMSRCPLCRTNSATRTRPKAVTSLPRGGAQGVRKRARARASTRQGRESVRARERERKLRLGWATRYGDAHHSGHRSSQKRPCYATSRRE